jgi:hypothetical protein
MLKLIGRCQTRRSLTLPSHSYRSRARNATVISAIPLTSAKGLNRIHGREPEYDGNNRMPKTASDTPLVPMSRKFVVSHLSCMAAIMRMLPIIMAQMPRRCGARVHCPIRSLRPWISIGYRWTKTFRTNQTNKTNKPIKRLIPLCIANGPLRPVIVFASMAATTPSVNAIRPLNNRKLAESSSPKIPNTRPLKIRAHQLPESAGSRDYARTRR